MNGSDTQPIQSFGHSTEAWVVETISKGMKRHQNTKCFNCGRIGHPLGMINIEGLNLLDYVEDAAKADIGPMNVDQQETHKTISYCWKTP